MAGQWQPGMAWADADSDDEQPRPMKPKVAPGNNQQMMQNQNQQQNQQGQQQQMMMMPMGMPMMGQQQPMMGQQQPMMGQQQPMMMMPMGMQQGQQMMMPMGMGQQMMMPMAMAGGQQGQQGMPMMMMVMPNGQPMMQQQPVAWAGQQMCQPAPAPANNVGSGDAAPKTVSAKAKESKRGSKLKNGKLGGNSDAPKVDDVCDGSGSVSSEKPTEASQTETPTSPCKEKALRHALLQRQASEVVQRLRQSGARRAGLADTAAQLRHSTFSALNLEVSSSSRRNSTAVHPLRRQSLAEFQRELKEAQQKKEASEKAAMISLPPGSWNKAKTECVSSPSASTRASGEEADVDGLAEFDNLVAA